MTSWDILPCQPTCTSTCTSSKSLRVSPRFDNNLIPHPQLTSNSSVFLLPTLLFYETTLLPIRQVWVVQRTLLTGWVVCLHAVLQQYVALICRKITPAQLNIIWIETHINIINISWDAMQWILMWWLVKYFYIDA